MAGNETGGSFGGGGAELALVLKFAGIEDTTKAAEEFFQQVNESKEEFSAANVKVTEILHEQAARRAGEVKDAADVVLAGSDASQRYQEVSLRLFDDVRRMGEAIIDIQTALGSLGSPSTPTTPTKPPKPTKPSGGIGDKVTKFLNVGEQASTAMNAGLSRITSQIPFGIGGFLGLLLLGKATDERLRTEAESYRQMFESTVSATDGPAFTTAHGYAKRLSTSLVQLTETFRVSKEEAGALVGSFVQGGVNAKELSDKTNIVVGNTTANVLIANAAIDQKLRLQSGTSAQLASRLMREYGMTSAKATGEVAHLALSAREAGVGVMTYMNDVMTAAGQMRMLGGTLTDARLMADTLRESLQKGGMGEHIAGAMALMATGQAAAGLSAMSKGLMMVIAREMGFGTDAGAYFAFRDQFMDPNRGPGMAIKSLTTLVDLIKKTRSDISEEETAVILEAQLGMSAPGAMILVRNLEVLKSATASKEDRTKAETAFKDALQKERSRTEDWKVSFKDLMLGLANVGSALFSMITTGLAEILIFMRRLPYSFNKWATDLGVKHPWAAGVVGALKEVAGTGALGPAAYFMAQPGNPAEQKRLDSLMDRAMAQNVKDIEKLRTGLRQAKQGGIGVLSPDSPGMRAFAGALGTPDSLRDMARRLDPAAVEQFINVPGSVGGQHLTGTLQPDEIVDLENPQQTRSTLSSVVSRLDPGSHFDPTRIRVTHLDIGDVASDGTAPVSVTFVYEEGGVVAHTDLAHAAGQANRDYSDDRVRQMIARVERENSWLPHGFLSAMANLESGSRGRSGGREFQPGALGRQMSGDRRAAGLLQVLTTGGHQTGQGGRGATTEQLLDPETNIRAWLPLAKRALTTSRAHEDELERMGRSVEVGARMLLFGMHSPTAKIIKGEGIAGTEEDTRRTTALWQRRFDHYQGQGLHREDPGLGRK